MFWLVYLDTDDCWFGGLVLVDYLVSFVVLVVDSVWFCFR